VYTVYDWGLPCRRQFLIRGDGSPCYIHPSVTECSICYPPQNESKTLAKFTDSDGESISNEIERLFDRWGGIAQHLNALIVTSPFAAHLYQSMGVNKSIIHEIPWFYNQPETSVSDIEIKNSSIRLGFLGRLVHEKGLHILLEALSRLDEIPQIVLEIAGVANNEYANTLKEKYGNSVGKHKVIWLGWIPNKDLGHFFRRIHALVVPSLWYDNTPTVLVEALAHHCPIICTDLPSMTHLVHHNKNGLVFPINDTQQLALQIFRFITEDTLACNLQKNADYRLNSKKYAGLLAKIYDRVIQK
jgi:glycosyltransferase involved in cell wall biosynthesis